MKKLIANLLLIVLFTEPVYFQSTSFAITGKLNNGKIINDEVRFLNLPERPENAMSGSEIANHVMGMSLVNREISIVNEILSGNVPAFSRVLEPLKINRTINATLYEVTLYTLCDYIAIGSDEDYLYIPMTPSAAQYLADILECSLPTKKLVDYIYDSSDVKLSPQPIPPSDKMTTIPVFLDHTDSVKIQINKKGIDRTGNKTIAGHKKDIIISNKIYSTDRDYDRVVIYGWHLGINNPIQPVYNGHYASYADYSHGIRFIYDTVMINEDQFQFEDILKDPNLSVLLSHEGIISKPYYPESDIFTSVKKSESNYENEFRLNQNYPNPFNPSTRISYSLNKTSPVELSIFNSIGEKVSTLVSRIQTAGKYEINWNAKSLTSGIYFCKIRAGSSQQSLKMILLQ